MARILSLEKPKNEPIAGYYDLDKPTWGRLQAKIKKYRDESIEVPLVIGGQEVETNYQFNSINPSDLSAVAKVHSAGPREIGLAIDSSLKAKKEWAGLDPTTRILLFKDLETILRDRREDINAAAMLECGYTALEADGGYAEMMDFVKFNPWFYHQILQEKPEDGVGETNYYVHRPLKGFTTAITPFNFPIAIGYNLPTVMALTGNTVVWKPSSDAVFTSSLLMKAIKDAGFPDGVINMVQCPGAVFGKNALSHPELTAVNFTGSYDTAWGIEKLVYGGEPRKHFPRIVAETGGKDFMWVDKSAGPWLDDIAKQLVSGAYGRTGQKCSATSRAYVPKELLPDLLDALKSQLGDGSGVTGDPTKARVSMGPVINKKAFDKITSHIKMARFDMTRQNPNYEIVAGGAYSDKGGFYISPTVVVAKNPRCKLMTEEIFGPVLTIHGYDEADEEATLKAMSEVPYKLTGSVYCKDSAKLEKLERVLANEAGNFYINRKTTAAEVARQPFGGDGASGTNRKAGSKEYLREFISPCVVGYRHTPAPTR